MSVDSDQELALLISERKVTTSALHDLALIARGWQVGGEYQHRCPRCIEEAITAVRGALGRG